MNQYNHKPHCATLEQPARGDDRHSPACPCPVCLGICDCGADPHFNRFHANMSKKVAMATSKTMNKLSPTEILAATFLVLYWSGHRDSGFYTSVELPAVSQIHEWLENQNELVFRQILDDGKNTFVRDQQVTQTEFFLTLAETVYAELVSVTLSTLIASQRPNIKHKIQQKILASLNEQDIREIAENSRE